MDISIDDMKTCSNCKYYIQHYIKSHGRFRKTLCGDCRNNVKIPKRNRLSFSCQLWENNAQSILDNKTSICSAIIAMSQRLDELYELLTAEIEPTPPSKQN